MQFFSTAGDFRYQIKLVAIFKGHRIQRLYIRAIEQYVAVIPDGLLFIGSHGFKFFLIYRPEMSLNIIPGFVNRIYIDGYSLCAEENPPRPDEVDVNFSQD